MTAAKWFPRHMPLAVVSLVLNGGMLHHSGQGFDFYLPSGQARNMRLGQAPFTSFIPIPDLGLAGAAATTACGHSVAEVGSARIRAFLGRAVRLPSLVLRLKLFVNSRPVKIALVRDNLLSLSLMMEAPLIETLRPSRLATIRSRACISARTRQ